MFRLAFAALLAALTAALASQPPGPAGEQPGGKPAPAPAPAAPAAGEMPRVTFAFDPGSHTRPIAAVGFSADRSKLITVGWDYTVRVWSTATGEKLDVLRLPPYGRDNGADTGHWDRAAVSPDGSLVAVGGGVHTFGKDADARPTKLVVVSVDGKRVRRVPLDGTEPITALSFSADGNRLAVGSGRGVALVDGIRAAVGLPVGSGFGAVRGLFGSGKAEFAVRDVRPEKKKEQFRPNGIRAVALSAAGDRLAVAEDAVAKDKDRVSLWAAGPSGWKRAGDFPTEGRLVSLDWAPDGSQVAAAWDRGGVGNFAGVALHGPDGRAVKRWPFADAEGLNERVSVATLRYAAADRLFVSAYGVRGDGTGYGALAFLLDPRTGKPTRLFADDTSHNTYRACGALSADGTLGATATVHGLGAVVYGVGEKKKAVVRCGSRTPVPTAVGWAKDPAAPALAWGDDPRLSPVPVPNLPRGLDGLEYGFDLARFEPVRVGAGKTDDRKPDAFDRRRLEHGNWTVATWGDKARQAFHEVHLKDKAGAAGLAVPKQVRSLTLVPNGNAAPLFAYGQHDFDDRTGGHAWLKSADGVKSVEWLPVATDHRDMVPSPDGRYVAVTTGTHRLSVYRTDWSQFPLLNLARADGAWVAWTSEGYYASSAGGDRLIGWAAHNGPDEFAAFHSAERYAEHFHRPDVLKLAFQKGSVSAALGELRAATPAVDPAVDPAAAPRARIAKLGQSETREVVKVRATATPRGAGDPLRKVMVLLDGRPLGGGRGVWEPKPGAPAEADFEVALTPGAHDLTVMALDADGPPAVSEPLKVIGPRPAGPQPTLYRVCVGINAYADPRLNLGAAVNDANKLFDALGKHCVGPANLFGAARGALLTDAGASKEGVLKAARDACRAANPGDLVVVFFAGHGVKSTGKDGTFYLLTRDANEKDLPKTAVSATELRKELEGCQAPVLLVLDACHSAGAGAVFRPSTDGLTRALTDPAVGVTVMTAAMSDEFALADKEHGHFTRALLNQLGGPAPLYNVANGTQYINHLYTAAHDAVTVRTDGKQTPTLIIPWTMKPVPVRLLPVPAGG